MSLQKINTRTIILALIIVVMAAFRLLTLKYQFLSNFTPVGAMAIFGGVYFSDKWKAYLVVLVTLVISDVIIDQFYSTIWNSRDTIWNCVCFSLIVLIGSLIKKINFANAIVIIFAPVIIHWLIMDLPWINSASYLYPKTLAGYGQALVAAIPFEKNMFFGDIVFGLILFGGFELAKTKYTSLRDAHRLAV